jgi:phage recombination protein Bet
LQLKKKKEKENVKMKNEIAVTEQYLHKNAQVIQNQFKLVGADLDFFLIQCARTGLDPITKQIYAIPAGQGKINIMASIDGLRLIAERSGAYEGQTKAEWCDKEGNWSDVWIKEGTPKAARVGVYKKGFREPLVATAMFDEYAQKQQYDDKYGKYKAGDLGHMWKKMPALMIAKVAEALALRKAFPNEMSGIYATEEIPQPEREVTAAPTLKKTSFTPWQGLPTKSDDIAENGSGFDLSPEVAALANQKVDYSDHVLTIGLNKNKMLKDIGTEEVFKFVERMWSNEKVNEGNVQEIRILEQWLQDMNYTPPKTAQFKDE